MTSRALAAALVGAALLPATAGATSGPLADTCTPAGQQVKTVCYGGDVVTRDAEAYADPGRFESALQAYERSWTHRTLAFQYELGNTVGMVDAPWLGTHNSFNSIAQQGPALSTTDANQQLTLVDQLRMDVRSLELDVHWFPRARAGGQNAPVVCHAGAVSDHDGCSTEPLLGPVLDQIAGWLHAHRDQVLLLYIEDHLAGGGYPAAVAAIQQSLGRLVYRTGSTSCTELPGDLSRADVLDAGAQVVIVANSGCGEGADWRSLAFSWRNHVEQTPHGFRADCGPDFTRADYDGKLVRYYEDSTWLSAGAGAVAGDQESEGLSPANVRAMTRFGKLANCAKSYSGIPILSSSIQEGSCSDDNGHGTHVSGTITAIANNGKGVTGVAFNSQLAMCKALGGPLGSGSTSDVANCIRWAHDKGANVISMSLGGGASTTLQQAVQYAWANGGATGSVVVAAAGNDGDATLEYPAAYPEVVSVAAADSRDQRASFSNANSDVEIAAPGVDVLSSYNSSDTSYTLLSGTSMATPHVAGVTAIIWDKYPTAAASTIRSKLDASVDDLGAAGRDTSFGFGRVNVVKAASS